MSTSTPGAPIPAMTVDTQAEDVEYQFVDDKGNQTTNIPPGVTVTFSDPNGIVTYTVDPNNPYRASIDPTGTPGTASITASVSGLNDASGNPVPNPDPVSVEVDPGQAVGGRLVVSEDPATPAPVVPPTDPTTPTDPGTPDPTQPSDPSGGTTPPDGGTTPTDPSAPSDPTDPAAPPVDPSAPDPNPHPDITSTDQLDRSVYTHDGPVPDDEAASWPVSGYVTGDGNNSPLFYFVGDTAPGQASGNAQDDGAWAFYSGSIQAAS